MRPLACCLIAFFVVGFAATAAEQTITITDYTGRGFAPDLVTYRLPAAATAAGGLRLFDADGQPVALQVDDRSMHRDGSVDVHFVASLMPGETRSWTLRDGGTGPAPSGAVTVAASGDVQLITTPQLGVRLPANRMQSFTTPVPARSLPAPILGFRSGDGPWRGAGRITSNRPVRRLEVVDLQAATAATVAQTRVYTLDFADGGRYEARITVVDGLPLVTVRETYDAGPFAGYDFWELELSTGWEPESATWARLNGNGGLAGDKTQPIAEAFAESPRYLVPDSAWGTPWSFLGLDAPDVAAAAAPRQMVGYVPLHKGAWRRMNAVEAHHVDGDVILRLPMAYRHASWTREVTSETSPFSMQEHDPNLPQTYARREWGLMLAPMPQGVDSQVRGKTRQSDYYQARLSYGVVGLDRYKDFILDWPAGAASYPRLAPRPDIAGAPTDKDVTACLKALDGVVSYLFTSPTVGHHTMAPYYLHADKADAILSHPELPAETRRAIRTRLALIMHLYEDADIISYANGSHPGNPNMGTARFASAPNFLALLPDHPLYAQWREHVAAYFEYKLRTQMAPGGGYFEYGAAYHMHGGARLLNGLQGLYAIGAPNADVCAALLRDDWQYYMDLLTPLDSRFFSRIIPGMANSPPGQTEHFGEAAGILARFDRDFAARLLWAWEQNGRNERNTNLAPLQALQPPLKPVAAELTSAYYPGVGVVFRAHQGPDETYLLFRSGFNWSHWYIDQGHFIMASRGAWILPPQPYQYHGPQDKSFDLYNTMRFGHPENQFPHAWPDSNIVDYHFGPTIDYAWSSTGYPDWYISPGITEPFRPKTDAPVSTGGERQLADGVQQTQGAFTWDRQLLFMKGAAADSPNYLIVRDSTQGAGELQRYLYLNFLGDQDDLKITGPHIGVNTEWPVRADIVFLEKDELNAELMAETQLVAVYNMNLQNTASALAKPSPNWVQKDGKPARQYPFAHGSGTREKHVVARIPAAPGQGYFWIVYPRGDAEPVPAIELLGENVVGVTHREGTDYVFAAPGPIELEGGDIVFSGQAGAIRVRPDSVTLALTAGSGRIGYQGYVVSGFAPFEVTVPIDQLKPGLHPQPVAPSGVIWQEPADAEGKPRPAVIREEQEDGGVRWTIIHDQPVRFQQPGLDVFANRAQVEITPDATRIVVPDPAYASISAGVHGVRGMGPFDLTFQRDRVTGRLDGKRRSLAVSWPAGILKPAYYMDGERYYAGWADDHSYGRAGTRESAQLGLAFAVLDGQHDIEIREWSYPTPPALPPTRRLELR